MDGKVLILTLSQADKGTGPLALAKRVDGCVVLQSKGCLRLTKAAHVPNVDKCGGLEPFFPYIGNVIIPTDEVIFFRGIGQPPTSYLYRYYRYYMVL
jgi:hypothetical protein